MVKVGVDFNLSCEMTAEIEPLENGGFKVYLVDPRFRDIIADFEVVKRGSVFHVEDSVYRSLPAWKRYYVNFALKAVCEFLSKRVSSGYESGVNVNFLQGYP